MSFQHYNSCNTTRTRSPYILFKILNSHCLEYVKSIATVNTVQSLFRNQKLRKAMNTSVPSFCTYNHHLFAARAQLLVTYNVVPYLTPTSPHHSLTMPSACVPFSPLSLPVRRTSLSSCPKISRSQSSYSSPHRVLAVV